MAKQYIIFTTITISVSAQFNSLFHPFSPPNPTSFQGYIDNRPTTMKTTVSFSIWKKLKMIMEEERERRIDLSLVFCKFMRDGKCSGEFNEALNCRKQYGSKCDDVVLALTQCCITHEDHYRPILTKHGEAWEDFLEQLRIKQIQEREQFFKDLKPD